MMATIQPSPIEPSILETLPDPLLHMRRFLLWKELPGKKGKTRKVPFYANGRPREGLLDTEADLAELVSFEDAWDEWVLGGYSGIGFALAGDKVGAFDLDHCLDDQGDLIFEHPGYDLVTEAADAGAYIEVSPSGQGLRIVGPCTMDRAYSKDGLEYWENHRYVTLTGNVWANPKGWQDLDELSAVKILAEGAKRARKQAVDDDEDDEGPIITQKVLDELRGALKWLDPDDGYNAWFNVAVNLKALPRDKGLPLWIEWSKGSKDWDEAEALQKWESADPERTSWQAIFKKAEDRGWTNPRSKKGRQDRDDETQEDIEDEGDTEALQGLSSLPGRWDLADLLHLPPTEFVLDGFMATGVSVIAGGWGSGKSTCLIPLFASVAHLAPEEWGFWPVLRRHVVWVAEAPGQAFDTLHSLVKEEGSASVEEFNEWFHLYPAKRQSVKSVVKKIKQFVEGKTWTTETGFDVKPVVVLDTVSANIDLENESDNSMVAAAMSTIKQALPGIPIVLVGHTPKALRNRVEIADMTFRGAGAWEAEAEGTFFLVYDEAAEIRFLAAQKIRFSAVYREINFDSKMGSAIVDTPWGDAQSKNFVHGVPSKSDRAARRAAQAEAREEQQEQRRGERMQGLQGDVLGVVARMVSEQGLPTRRQIANEVDARRGDVMDAINQLVEEGRLNEHQIHRRFFTDLRGPTPTILLPSEVDLEIYLENLGTSGNQ